MNVEQQRPISDRKPDGPPRTQANVLLDVEGHAHLCDFGLAKCVEGDWRGGPRKSFAGTVEYMAPELLSKGADAPSPALDWRFAA